MVQVNTKVLQAVTEALSNDRYPKDDVGYVVSDNDKGKITTAIKDEILAGATDDSIQAAIKVFGNSYKGASPEDLKPWAARNSEVLDELAARVPHLRQNIVGQVNGGLASIEKLQAKLETFSRFIMMSPCEDGIDTNVSHMYRADLAGASAAKIKQAFATDEGWEPDTDDGVRKLEYTKGEAAIDDYLSKVEFDDYAYYGDEDAANFTPDKLRELLQDPMIKRIHCVTDWHSDWGEWGVEGSGDTQLILELESGHFLNVRTSGGWQ